MLATQRALIRAIAYAGMALPMLMAALMWLVDHPDLHGFVAVALAGYAGSVLAFQGGAHWSLSLRNGAAHPLHLLWSAGATLCGWLGGNLMAPAAGLPFLAVTHVVCHLVDNRTWRRAGLDAWLTLRFHGTVALSLSCLAGAAATN